MRHFEPSDTVKRLPEQFFAKLVKKAHDLTEAGHDVINLGQGNPDLPTPSHIVDKMKHAVDNPDYHKYSPFRGHMFLKEAITDFYKKEYDVELDPIREVALLAGSKTGLVDISQCLLNSGDLALLPDPGYPDYMSGIAIAQASTSFMPLRAENDFLPNYSSVSPDVLARAKLMFLNYPNNPTAGTASPSFFAETVDVAKRHDICVCHDFAYAAIGFDGEKPPSFLQAEGAREIGIEMYTLSKTFNMAGWRAAFAVGNASVINMINLMQDHKYMSLFGAVQQAAMHALVSPQDAVRQLVTTYEQRRDLFIDALQRAGWHVPAPKGTFFAWLPVPDGYSSETFADLLLEEAHVVVAPGIGFGDNGEGFVRAGLVASEERLREAAARIEKLNLF
ncbi:pyridoxal phosphate-dependent aminotransferase [Salipaludibacillus sp. LMS25]|jgi:aminotransferase|uniref:pyridoxal phosphate-dependent aminotransferase n=1 Tax=Salipaludibacillus sp. LMS25 TaxID=2924031 RepID=UPI0020D03677|nr:pyridoxal phosphate-dependent aminotransferase [Salipaludibacillus sp. LMS25]UTR16358.1 pyridoxal phosphate-dependent aminotransferase [Salipaludibacillus sp. LMS25]